MNYRTLGRTGLRVSEIGFGGWAIGGAAFGNSYGPTDDAASRAAIQRALELGCTFFDAADVYGHGHSEELLGQALHDAAARDQVIIATKVGANFYHRDVDPALAPGLSRHLGRPLADFPADAVLPVAHGANFRPDYLRFACEQSLRRLRREVIDLYQLHNPGLALIEQGEIWQALDDLKQAGKIRFYGVSIHQPVEGIAALVGGKADTIQVVYNLLDQAAASQLFPLALALQVGIIAREPLANGFLAGKYGPDTRFAPGDMRATWPADYVTARSRAAQTLAAEWVRPGQTLAQAAIRFALDHPAVSTVIPGAKTPGQVEQNLAAGGVWSAGFGARGLEREGAKGREGAKTRRREDAKGRRGEGGEVGGRV
ncbi:MAG: aldo/keto reductase [Anaerolineae bacterium]